MARAEAVLFDLDGVLVHSTRQHYEAYRRVLAPLGIDLAPREIYLREGGRSRTIIEQVLQDHGRPRDAATVERLAREKQEVFRGLGSPKPVAGAQELVRELARGRVPIGLVTGTERKNAEHMLGPLLSLFPVAVTNDVVPEEKPHPGPYLAGAERLKVVPDRCIVVENAVLGVRAAKAAGMRCVAVTTTLEPVDLAEADVVLSDFGAVRDYLRVWLS
ncbi:MAG: HAD family hydrolase [Methanobacteriota archaeon]